MTPPAVTGDQIFEIDIAARYGDIIEYGVRLKDGMTDGANLSNVTLEVLWETGTYTWWEEQFTVSPSGPSNPIIGDVETPDIATGEFVGRSYNPNSTSYYDTENSQEVYQDVFKIVLVDEAGMNFSEDEFVAKFMLKKLTPETESVFTLGKAQYNEYSAAATGEERPIQPAPSDKSFFFDAHDFNMRVATKYDVEIPNVELLVTDLGTSDGLSIVPVAKNGNIIKYEIVLNIPKPSFIADVPVPDHHIIQINGAAIFENSIQLLTDTTLTTSQTGEVVGDAGFTATAKDVDGNVLSMSAPTSATYLGQEFFHKIEAAMDPTNSSGNLSDLSVTDLITFEVNNVTKPIADGNTAETRYVLAEFYALDDAYDLRVNDNTIHFMSDSSTTAGSYDLPGSVVKTITRMYDDGSAVNGQFYAELSDGSEYVILGDGLYLNENMYNDAVGAEDALGALKIHKAAVSEDIDTVYSKEAIIAADFNQSGEVTAADAADILSYIVNGETPGLAMPEWVYVNTDAIDEAVNNGALFDADNVHFDTVMDEFAYQPTNYTGVDIPTKDGTTGSDGEITAILRGDVTSSYSAAPDSYRSVDEFAFFVELLNSEGLFDLTMTEEIVAGGTEFYAEGTSGQKDIFYLGDTDGAHYINIIDYNTIVGTDTVSDVLILSDELYNNEVSWGDDGVDILYNSKTAALDMTAVYTALSDALKSDDGLTIEHDAVYGNIEDDDGVDGMMMIDAWDLNGDGIINPNAGDLVIFTVGSLYPLWKSESDVLNPDSYMS